MLTDSIDANMLIAVILGLSCLLFVAYLDRCFARRRNLAANARYMRRTHAGRRNSRLHWMGAVNRGTRDARFAELIIEPENEIRKPGFFSRRRVFTDCLGRVVATHYEELILVDLDSTVPTRLMLT